MAAQLYRTLTGQSQKSQERPGSTSGGLQRSTTTDPLTGSLNHLNADQLTKLDIFKKQLEKDGWWTPNGVNGKPSHDDGTLLRYLRARKFDINGAVGQFSDTEKWMKEQRVEELYEHFDVDFYERARTLYPQWTGRRDKRGIPIYVYEIKGLDSKNVNKYQKESQAYKDKQPNHKGLATPAKLLPLFALYHNLLNMVLPMCSLMERPNPEVPITNSTNIVDITGVGLTQFWNLKQHMQDASVLATAHYPETLDRIFIIGAPSFFPTVWGWIKRWFDPVTVSKIFILSKNEVKPTLEKFMDLKNVPKKYGGELDWGWGELPILGEEERKIIETDGRKGWIKGPCLFLEHRRLPVGSENGKLRRSDEEIAEKKPVLYAADYTEEPVHPDRKRSSASISRSAKPTNGAAVAPAAEHIPAVSEAPAAAEIDPTIPATTATEPPPTTAAAVANVEPIQKPTTPPAMDTRHLNVHNSPSGDSQVHLPSNQPAAPAVTAEYISPQLKPKTEGLQREPSPTSVNHTSAAPEAGQALHSNPVATVDIVPPPGLTQPGPLPEYAVAINQQIARKLEGESVSVIPAEANGKLPHPEMIVASDRAKGLAMEADKLALNGSAESQRPQMERFVTAAQF